MNRASACTSPIFPLFFIWRGEPSTKTEKDWEDMRIDVVIASDGMRERPSSEHSW